MSVTERLAWAAVAATLVLIALGGLVRATDSGLACPDWPACYGQWIPPADLQIWFEHSHRLWAGVVLLLILALTVVTRRRDRRLFALSLTTLGLVLVQAALGALVVLLLLRAELVTAHLLTSFAVVALLVTIAVGASTTTGPARGRDEDRVSRWATLVAALVLVQAVLGAQGTGQGIAYVFNAVPLWLAGDAWTGDTRQVLHLTHRVGGYVVAAAVLALALAVRRRAADGGARRALVLLTGGAAVLVVVQVGLGLANALTRGAPWSATAHLAVASWIWTCVVAAAAVALRPSPVASRPSATAEPELVVSGATRSVPPERRETP